MLETLNDDCQLLIINYLELKDQLALWEAAHDVDIRLNSNVSYAWHHQTSHVLDKEILDELQQHPKYMEAFLCSIGPTLEKLNLRYIQLAQLESWKGHRFPSMRALRYTLDEDEEFGTIERFSELLVELFPELVSIMPFGPFHSSIFARWSHLRELNLTDSWPTDENADLREFQMLEALTIDCDIFKNNFIVSLWTLPKLRTITFYTGTKTGKIMGEIIQRRGQDIRQLVFNDIIWDCSLESLQKVTNLRQLTLLEDDGFKVDQLQALVAALPLLEQLNLIDFQFFRNEVELWQTIACCRSLQVLNISGMQLYEEFFDSSRRSMEKALGNRTTPLTLHCYDTGHFRDTIRQLFQHDNLTVSFEPQDVDYVETGCVKIALVPLLN